jgi:hypothetical protein
MTRFEEFLLSLEAELLLRGCHAIIESEQASPCRNAVLKIQEFPEWDGALLSLCVTGNPAERARYYITEAIRAKYGMYRQGDTPA